MGAGDWKPTEFGDREARTLQLAERQGLVKLVEAPLSLGDGLTILPAPGETPGHQILHLAHHGRHIYFAGDLYHHPLEFTEADRNVTWAEVESMQASKEALCKRAAAEGARMYFAHIEGL